MAVLEELTVVSTRRRELAHRCAAGIDVTLYWDAAAELVTVDVVDLRAGECFELLVPRARALDAFNHPFAYAASGERLEG
ncbi:MAG: hypothetical protein ACJ757_13705 [Gaiellaceae bacterium]